MPALDEHDVLDRRCAGERFVGHPLQWHHLTAPVAAICGHEDLGLLIVDAIAQRLRAEAAKDDAVDSADSGAGEHRNRQLRDERQIDGDTIAARDAERLEDVGELTDLAKEVPVRQRPAVARFTFPDDCGLVATRRPHVPIDTVHAGVQLAAREPFRVGRLPLEHGVPGLRPVELAREGGPERLWIAGRLFVDGCVAHVGALGESRRRIEMTRFLQQRVDIGLVG